MESPKFIKVKSSLAKSSYIVAFVLFILLLTPSNAFAHGIGGTSGSDSSAKVKNVNPSTNQFSAISVENGQRIKITRSSKNDLIVIGIDLEPYLKFSDKGVYVNERSATAIINKSTNNSTNTNDYTDEFAKTSSDPNEPPIWKKLTSSQTYIFHDHRTHYMGRVSGDSKNLGSNFLPISIENKTYKVEVQYLSKSAPNSLAWFIAFSLLSIGLIITLLKTDLLKTLSKKTYLLSLLLVLFVFETIHVVGYIIFIQSKLLSALEQSLYGLILLALIPVCIWKVLKNSDETFLYKSAPWLSALGLFGLIVDTLGEYKFFVYRYLPTNLPDNYSRISLILIGLISLSLFLIGIINISEKNRVTTNSQVPV